MIENETGETNLMYEYNPEENSPEQQAKQKARVYLTLLAMGVHNAVTEIINKLGRDQDPRNERTFLQKKSTKPLEKVINTNKFIEIINTARRDLELILEKYDFPKIDSGNSWRSYVKETLNTGFLENKTLKEALQYLLELDQNLKLNDQAGNIIELILSHTNSTKEFLSKWRKIGNISSVYANNGEKQEIPVAGTEDYYEWAMIKNLLTRGCMTYHGNFDSMMGHQRPMQFVRLEDRSWPTKK